MAIDPSSPRSRRALLTAAVAATAVTVAEAVARPLPASAVDGANFVLGEVNTAALPTRLTNDSASYNALQVEATGFNATAIFGHSLTGSAVVGQSTTGTGVSAVSVSEPAVTAVSTSGAGLISQSDSGIGVYARSFTGNALHVEGKAHFTRSGKATVTAGHLSVTVTVEGGLRGTPLCFANLRSYRSGVAVAAVRPNYPSAGQMRIYLTKSVSSSTSVAWIVTD